MQNFKKSSADLLKKFIILIIKMIPTKILLFVKAEAEIVRKMDYNKKNIYLNIESGIEYETRLHSCKKEPETVSWIEEFFKEGDIFFDVGANIGAYSLVADKFLNGKIKTYAFEPSFTSFVKLCRNIVLNKCQDSILPLQIALSDRTTMDLLNYSNLNPGGALHVFGALRDYKGNSFEPVLKLPVLSYKMDDFIEQFKTPFPNHIKIDVDGIEPLIIKGAEQTLKIRTLKTILIELNEGMVEHSGIINKLKDYGFSVCYKKHAQMFDQGEFSEYFNFVFIRK